MIEGLPLGNIGATGLLALVVLMILTDRLVWHKRLDVLAKQVETKDALIDELSKQNTMLLGSAVPTVNAVLGALHRAAGDREQP
jgi:septum formation inhibitor-activating ATPase MinD